MRAQTHTHTNLHPHLHAHACTCTHARTHTILPGYVDRFHGVPGHVEGDGLCVLVHDVFLGQHLVDGGRPRPERHAYRPHQVEGDFDEALEFLATAILLELK
jgi:hypothetical protein